MDPYKILGISPEATPDEIRRAYREKARKHHPDTDGDAWAFQQVHEAYALLTGKTKRKRPAKNRASAKTSTSKHKSTKERNEQPRSDRQRSHFDPFERAGARQGPNNTAPPFNEQRIDSPISINTKGKKKKQKRARKKSKVAFSFQVLSLTILSISVVVAAVYYSTADIELANAPPVQKEFDVDYTVKSHAKDNEEPEKFNETPLEDDDEDDDGERPSLDATSGFKLVDTKIDHEDSLVPTSMSHRGYIVGNRLSGGEVTGHFAAYPDGKVKPIDGIDRILIDESENVTFVREEDGKRVLCTHNLVTGKKREQALDSEEARILGITIDDQVYLAEKSNDGEKWIRLYKLRDDGAQTRCEVTKSFSIDWEIDEDAELNLLVNRRGDLCFNTADESYRWKLRDESPEHITGISQVLGINDGGDIVGLNSEKLPIMQFAIDDEMKSESVSGESATSIAVNNNRKVLFRSQLKNSKVYLEGNEKTIGITGDQFVEISDGGFAIGNRNIAVDAPSHSKAIIWLPEKNQVSELETPEGKGSSVVSITEAGLVLGCIITDEKTKPAIWDKKN